MISLKRIVEQQGADGQYYDLGRDFANFRRTIDGSFDQIKQKFEQIIGAKLNGKRVRARASRGYKQYVKDYEFDVAKITLDDYYDNYVVVAHDNATPKAKEYFLKPGFKIQILGAASGQPSSGSEKGKETHQATSQVTPQANPDTAQAQPMQPAPAGVDTKPQPVKEGGKGTGHYDAYSIEAICKDIKPWMLRILRKPETAIRDFVVGLGWLKDIGEGKSVALYDLKLPVKAVKITLNKNTLTQLLSSGNKMGTITSNFELVSATLDDSEEVMTVRVKKTMIDTTAAKAV